MPARLNGLAFSDDTIPTEDQVQGLIDDAADELVSFVGEEIAEEHETLARIAVAYATAAEIEVLFWPEQNPAGDDDTPHAYYVRQYEARRDRLVKLNVDQAGVTQTAGMPTSHFPTPSTGSSDESFEPIGSLRF